MLAFPCPRCGSWLQVQEQWAGRKVRCGPCQAVVDVPRTPVPAALPGVAPAPPPPPAPPAAANAPPAPSAGRELYDFLSTPQAADELGRLGGYRILEVLGSGGMGVVFRAEDVQLRRPVALKALLPALAADPDARERFLREARAMAAAGLAHDNIVTLYQVGEARDIPFLAMELLEGESLEDRLRREDRLPPAEAVRIGREVAEGLAAAHERGIVHRDIKPGNIWLEFRPGEPGGGSPRFRVKLLDFGLARVAGEGSGLTRSGVLIGTPGYIAPEQVQNGTATPSSDLFSLGCVLYHLCAGRPPFQGKDTLATLAALATEPAQPVRDLNPDVPPALAGLIMRLLARDPAGRPPSARAVADALEASTNGRPAARTPPPSDPRPAPRPADAPGRGRPAPGPVDPHGLSTWPIPMMEEPLAAVPDDEPLEAAPVRRSRAGCVLAAVLTGVVGVMALMLCGTGVALLAWTWLDARPPAARAAANDKEAKPPPGEPFVSIQAGIRQHKYTQTKVAGGAFAPLHFEDVPPEGGVLIGFEVGLGANGNIVDYLRPIYVTAEGEKLGALCGRPAGQAFTVKAKPGFAVGGMTIHGGGLLDGFSITFMRIDRKGLAKDGSYNSDWIGGPGGGEEVVAGDGSWVIGICGRKMEDRENNKPGGLGLVVLRPE
jgi:serine/threonine protein kinase